MPRKCDRCSWPSDRDYSDDGGNPWVAKHCYERSEQEPPERDRYGIH